MKTNSPRKQLRYCNVYKLVCHCVEVDKVMFLQGQPFTSETNEHLSMGVMFRTWNIV